MMYLVSCLVTCIWLLCPVNIFLMEKHGKFLLHTNIACDLKVCHYLDDIWIKSRPLIRKVQNLCPARIFLLRNIGSSNTTQRSTWPKVIWLSLRSLEWKNYYLCLLCTVLKEKYGKFLFFSKNFRIIKVNHSKLPHVFVHCSS